MVVFKGWSGAPHPASPQTGTLPYALQHRSLTMPGLHAYVPPRGRKGELRDRTRTAPNVERGPGRSSTSATATDQPQAAKHFFDDFRSLPPCQNRPWSLSDHKIWDPSRQALAAPQSCFGGGSGWVRRLRMMFQQNPTQTETSWRFSTGTRTKLRVMTQGQMAQLA